MKTLRSLFLIEMLYDSFQKEELELLSQASSDPFASIADLYLDLWERKSSSVYEKARILLMQDMETDLKAVVLQAAIAMTEIEYDLKLRKRFILSWNDFSEISLSSYAQHLFYYQRGMGFFYEGALNNALENWESSLKLAVDIQYKRGEFRLLFHIGLIYKEKGLNGKARTFFKESLEKAQAVEAKRFIKRIEEQIQIIDNGYRLFNEKQKKIQDHLVKNENDIARKLVLAYCRQRRSENRHWDAQSEDLLLAEVALAFGKIKTFHFIVNRISDDYIRLVAFEFANRVNDSAYSFDKEIAFLKQALKISDLAEMLPSSFGKFNQDDEDESKKFIAILEVNQKGLTKEEICRQLWNYDYDPILHDNRIYKLIHKTRKYLGLKSSITHAYGGRYRIHEDWIKNKKNIKTSGVSG